MITKYIYLGENRIASKSGTTVYYYHSDHLGSTNLITNSSGSSQAQLCEYKPYGELARNTAQLTKYYFTGKELDSTGLYYYGARYYDPKIGRFITADNFVAQPYNPQYLNRYSYCMNNPLRYIDPTGNYQVDVNEIEPGDIGLQRVGTNIVSNFPGLIGESYAHGFLVLEANRNPAGDVTSIRMGELRAKPENQRILTSESFYYNFITGKRSGGKLAIVFGEKIQDYDFFRVTNYKSEADYAVARAESPNAWYFKMDPNSFFKGLLTKKDFSNPFDSKMICSEYLNFLYDNKFNNPMNGITTPSDIINYQNNITRPYDFTLNLNQWNNFISDYTWKDQYKW